VNNVFHIYGRIRSGQIFIVQLLSARCWRCWQHPPLLHYGEM